MKKIMSFALFLLIILISCSNEIDNKLDEYEKSVNKYGEVMTELLNTNNTSDINVLVGEVSDTLASLGQMIKYLDEIPEMTKSQNLRYMAIREKQVESAEIINKILP